MRLSWNILQYSQQIKKYVASIVSIATEDTYS